MIKLQERLKAIFQKKFPPRYFPNYVLLMVSLLASYYFFVPEDFFAIEERWFRLSYLLVYGSGFLLVLLVVTVMQRINCWLDMRVPWMPNIKKRLRSQLLYSFLWMIVLLLLLVYLVYGVGFSLGWEWMLSYTTKSAFKLALLILVINGIYAAWYFWSTAYYTSMYAVQVRDEAELLRDQLAQQAEMSLENSDFLLTLRVKDGHKEIFLPIDSIAYFESVGSKRYCAKLGNKYRYGVNDTLDQLMERLDNQQFCKVNRNFIVNRDAVLDLKGDGSGKLILTLREDLKLEEPIVVSRDHANVVRNWMERTDETIGL